MKIKEHIKKLKSDLPILFLALKDKETPLLAKVMAGITVAYALSPIDLVPDFIPVLGYLDDLIILPILAAFTLKLIPKEVYERNQEKAKDLWTNGKPKEWYYAIPIVVLWILIAVIIVKMVIK
jgi:Uncharacterized conserved protein